MLNDPLPAGLCPFHKELCRRWRENHYDSRRPSEWPGGAPLMDARTSHAERERGWDEKNRAEMQRVAEACRSGRSRQCTPPASPVSLPKPGPATVLAALTSRP